MENKKANTNVKTTMDFFKQKRAKANNKKLFSHIEINSDTNKPSFATTSNFNSTNQSIYKSDIFQIDTYLNKIKPVLMYFSEARENLLLYNKEFNNKINLIKKNLEIDTKDLMATNHVKSLNLNNIIKEYNNCEDKNVLISEIALENYTLKLLLEKLDDLFFLINIKNFDYKQQFSKNKTNLSQIVNIKYLLDQLINDDNSDNNIKEATSSNSLRSLINTNFKEASISLGEKEGVDNRLLPISQMNSNNDLIINEVEESKEKEGKTIYESKQEKSKYYSSLRSIDKGTEIYDKEISAEIVKDISKKINEMKKFSDFLNFDYEEEEFFKEIFDKIRELFYIYNMHIFDPIVELINTKIQIKSDLVDKVQIVLKNEVNDVLENVILIRKVLEDSYKELQTKIDTLTKDKQILEKQYQELETNFNKQKKTLDEIGNRDYTIYYKQMKESNDFFLKEFESIEKKRNEKIHEQYEIQLEKNKQLKSEIQGYKTEIFALKMKVDNINAIQDKKGDEYVTALKEQFEDAIEGFKEHESNMKDDYEKKIEDLRVKYNNLENENRRLKTIQGAIMKKLDTMESLFSK